MPFAAELKIHALLLQAVLELDERCLVRALRLAIAIPRVRGRSEKISFRRTPKFPCGNNLLGERLKTRIAAERVEKRMNSKIGIIWTGISDTLLQPSNGFVALSQTEAEESAIICAHVAVTAEFVQLSQHLHGRAFVA